MATMGLVRLAVTARCDPYSRKNFVEKNTIRLHPMSWKPKL